MNLNADDIHEQTDGTLWIALPPVDEKHRDADRAWWERRRDEWDTLDVVEACPSAAACLSALNWHNVRGGPEPECDCDERQSIYRPVGQVRITGVLDRINLVGDCWVWQGGRDRDGYPKKWINGTTERLHRIIAGATPDVIARHTCDNPPCVNPKHLTLGSHADNAVDRDIRQRHRTATGDAHLTSKLTQAQVDEIRVRLKSGAVNITHLAAEFGVTGGTVRHIRNGTTWASGSAAPDLVSKATDRGVGFPIVALRVEWVAP